MNVKLLSALIGCLILLGGSVHAQSSLRFGSQNQQLQRLNQKNSLELKMRQNQYLQQRRDLDGTSRQRLENQQYRQQLRQKDLQQRQLRTQGTQRQVESAATGNSGQRRLGQNLESQRFASEQRQQALEFKTDQGIKLEQDLREQQTRLDDTGRSETLSGFKDW